MVIVVDLLALLVLVLVLAIVRVLAVLYVGNSVCMNACV